ncbi:hypothetical protein EJB05_20693, partial [Eragrostis curvula]
MLLHRRKRIAPLLLTRKARKAVVNPLRNSRKAVGDLRRRRASGDGGGGHRRFVKRRCGRRTETAAVNAFEAKVVWEHLDYDEKWKFQYNLIHEVRAELER